MEATTLKKRYPLQMRKIVKKRFVPFVTFTALWVAGAYLMLSNAGFPRSFGASWDLLDLWNAWVACLFLGLAVILGYEIIYFVRYFYDIADDTVTIRKGVIAQTEVTLPLTKITDVFVDQDTLDVIFGLYDLHISTPTAESGRFAHIDGLNRRGAMEIRRLILDRMTGPQDAPPQNEPKAGLERQLKRVKS